ncbi:hypothetical protein GJ496_002962 [Pomphorhynchus laevis]|nr:hypothetical protein GJ496_002962 [Pomphorhynchus laevis]
MFSSRSVLNILLPAERMGFDPINGEVSNFCSQPSNWLFVNDILNTLWQHLDESCASYIESRYLSANYSVFIFPVDSLIKKYKDTQIIRNSEHEQIQLNESHIDGDSGDSDFGRQITECIELLHRSPIKKLGDTIFNFPKNLHAVAICIESHEYQGQNYWTGNWTSQWVIIPISHGKCRLLGIVNAQDVRIVSTISIVVDNQSTTIRDI